MTVGLCEIEELPDYCVKGFGNLHGAVAENGRPLGGENVLTRTAGVDKGYRRRSFCDEERLIGNVAFHAQRRVLLGLGFKTSDAARGFPRSFVRKEALSRIDDNGRLVDGAGPEKFIALHVLLPVGEWV